VVEFWRQRIDQWHNLIAARHREAAARAKVILDINHEKQVVFASRQIVGQ
jgi:hypothetical protein